MNCLKGEKLMQTQTEKLNKGKGLKHAVNLVFDNLLVDLQASLASKLNNAQCIQLEAVNQDITKPWLCYKKKNNTNLSAQMTAMCKGALCVLRQQMRDPIIFHGKQASVINEEKNQSNA